MKQYQIISTKSKALQKYDSALMNKQTDYSLFERKEENALILNICQRLKL